MIAIISFALCYGLPNDFKSGRLDKVIIKFIGMVALILMMKY